MLSKINEKAIELTIKKDAFIRDQKGNAAAGGWEVAVAIAAVLGGVVVIKFFPDVVQDIWDRFINFMTDKFGI